MWASPPFWIRQDINTNSKKLILLTPETYGGYVVKGIISVQCFLKWQKSTLFSQQIFWRTKKLCMGKTWQERLNNPGFINRWLRASNIAFFFGGFQHFGQTFVCAQKVVWTCPKLSARIVVATTGSKLIILPTDLCVNFFWFLRKYYHKIKRHQNHCRSCF